MTTRAWTLGSPEAYEKAIRIFGNGKAPGGYAFETEIEAADYTRSHPEARRFRPYAIELPATFEEDTTSDFIAAQRARHEWHTHDDPGEGGHGEGVEFMPDCGICEPWRSGPLDCRLLLVAASFVNPD